MAPPTSADPDVDGIHPCTPFHLDQLLMAESVDMTHEEEDDQGERLINEGRAARFCSLSPLVARVS